LTSRSQHFSCLALIISPIKSPGPDDIFPAQLMRGSYQSGVVSVFTKASLCMASYNQYLICSLKVDDMIANLTKNYGHSLAGKNTACGRVMPPHHFIFYPLTYWARKLSLYPR